MSGAGAGAENGAERARKPDEREGSGTRKNYGGAGAGGRVSGKWERSGERAESAAHNPLKHKLLIDVVSACQLFIKRI